MDAYEQLHTRLLAAIEECRQRKTAKAARNLPILEALRRNPDLSIREIAKDLNCSHGQVGNVKTAVRKGDYRRLWQDGNKARSKTEISREPLKPQALQEIKDRLASERDRLGIPEGSFQPSGARADGRDDKVAALGAVLLLRTTNKNISEIARKVGATRAKVYEWAHDYDSAGLERLLRSPAASAARDRQCLPAEPRANSSPTITCREPGLIQKRADEEIRSLVSKSHTHGGFLRKPLVFLYGVRGSGKTTLIKRISGLESDYYDCEDPKVLRSLANPAEVFAATSKAIIILDEPGQLRDLRDPHVVLDAALGSPKARMIVVVSSIAHIEPVNQKCLFFRPFNFHPIALSTPSWEERLAWANKAASITPYQHALVWPGLPALRTSGDPLRSFRRWAGELYEKDLPHSRSTRDQFTKWLEMLYAESGKSIELEQLASRSGAELAQTRVWLDHLKDTGLFVEIKPDGSGHAGSTVIFAADTGCLNIFQKNAGPDVLWRHLVAAALYKAVKDPGRLRVLQSQAGPAPDFLISTENQGTVAASAEWSPGNSQSAFVNFRCRFPFGINLVVTPRVASGFFDEQGLRYLACSPKHLIAFLPDSVLSPSDVVHARYMRATADQFGAELRAMLESDATPAKKQNRETVKLWKPDQHITLVYNGRAMDIFELMQLQFSNRTYASAALPEAVEAIRAAFDAGALEKKYSVRPMVDAPIGEEVFVRRSSCDCGGDKAQPVAVFGCMLRNGLSKHESDFLSS